MKTQSWYVDGHSIRDSQTSQVVAVGNDKNVQLLAAAPDMYEALATINTGLDGLKKIMPTMTVENRKLFEIVLYGGGEMVKAALKKTGVEK